MSDAPILRNRRLLIVHECRFWRSRLAGIVESAGAAVIGPAAACDEGMALLADRLPVHAMIVSQQLPGRGVMTLLDEATDRNVRTVIVHPASAEMTPPLSDHRCIATPCRDGEIVDALVDALTATRGCIHWSTTTEQRWLGKSARRG